MTKSATLAVQTVKNRKSKILNDLGAIALLIALVLFFFWRIITPRLEDRAAFPPGDFTDQFWAFRMYEARAFAEGRLPLWSDNFNSGHPFLADVQSAIFYPVSLIYTLGIVALRGENFTLLDLEVEAILHFILAGAFTYLFARRLLESRIAALISALTFTFGGYLTSYPPQQLAILETATWLPLILLLIHSALYRGGKYYYAAGVVLGIAALAGHPQTFLFVVYASAIYFFWESRHHSHFLLHYVLRFTIVLILAAGISAAQWVPTLEYQTVSTRAAITWAEASRGFPTLDPIQLILPGYSSAFQAPLYIGIFPLWLALVALMANRSREKIFWLALGLGSLLIAFGAYLFLYALLYLFAPGFAMFRGQERLALVFSFSLAMLAGYGMRELLTSDQLPRARRAFALLPMGMVLSILMVVMIFTAAAQRQAGRLFFLGDRAGLMVLLFLLATILAAARLSDVLKQNRFVAFTIALLALDLFTIGNPAYNAELKPRYPITPIIQAIHEDRGIFRVADEGRMPGHFGIAYRLEEIGGISPLRVARYEMLLDNLPEEKLWQLLNVRYVTTRRPGFADAQVVAQVEDTRLLRLQNELPRAWFVASARERADDRAALETMQNDSFDPRQTALVSESLPFSPNSETSRMTATFLRLSPEHLQINVNASNDGLLMLSEVHYPGWRATVDGNPAPILRADIALSAVPVRAGATRVELVYDPWSVKMGIGVTTGTIMLMLVAALLARQKAPALTDR